MRVGSMRDRIEVLEKPRADLALQHAVLIVGRARRARTSGAPRAFRERPGPQATNDSSALHEGRAVSEEGKVRGVGQFHQRVRRVSSSRASARLRTGASTSRSPWITSVGAAWCTASARRSVSRSHSSAGGERRFRWRAAIEQALGEGAQGFAPMRRRAVRSGARSSRAWRCGRRAAPRRMSRALRRLIPWGQSLRCTKQGVVLTRTRPRTRSAWRRARRCATSPPSDQPQTVAPTGTSAAIASTASSKLADGHRRRMPVARKVDRMHARRAASSGSTSDQAPECNPQPCSRTRSGPRPVRSTWRFT